MGVISHFSKSAYSTHCFSGGPNTVCDFLTFDITPICYTSNAYFSTVIETLRHSITLKTLTHSQKLPTIPHPPQFWRVLCGLRARKLCIVWWVWVLQKSADVVVVAGVPTLKIKGSIYSMKVSNDVRQIIKNKISRSSMDSVIVHINNKNNVCVLKNYLPDDTDNF